MSEQHSTGGRSHFFARWLIGALLLWCVVLFVVGPWLIRQAYAERSIELLNNVFSGREQHPVERYLGVWRRLALVATAVIVPLTLAGRWAYLHPGRAAGLRDAVFRTEPSLSAPAALGHALWLGMAMGLLEAWVWFARFKLDGLFSAGSNMHTLWLAPLVQGGLFVSVVCILLLLFGGRPKRLSIRTIVMVTLSVGLWSALSRLRLGIHPVALFILCAGCAAQLARIAARDHEPYQSLVRRSMPLFGVATLLPFLLLVPVRDARAARAIEALQAAPVGAPNILLIVLDTVRLRSLGLHGYSRATTPQLDRYAERSVVFDHAISPSPWTLPAHASFFTGRLPYEFAADWELPLDDRWPTVAEYLSDHGWATGGFVANYAYTTRASGLDRGFVTYRDHELKLAQMVRASLAASRLFGRLTVRRRWVSPARKFAASVNSELLAWVDDLEDRPWFAFLNYYDAHFPYERFPEIDTFEPEPPYTTVVAAEPGERAELPATTWTQIDRYESGIAYMDGQIGRLLGELETRGVLENTVVIVTSDHGEQFLERGLTGHSNSLYAELTRVPLLVSWPEAIPQGFRTDVVASLRDLPATIVDLAGVEDGAPFPGRSLRRAWSTPDEADSAATAFAQVNVSDYLAHEGPLSRGPLRAVSLGRWHYIRNGDAVEELYDVVADPEQAWNLAGEPHALEALREMRQALREASVPP